ncbi:angiotensin-converting enzyme [Teleopsis dalmanni]|uniref:angiotensin-converting enzyme n=1 Tax=Teleopsis dalmanni TaxID=139649 RepID=UPI0018CDE95E|nr:angiotensin-converting enzyme [Teleopsis dalmanni]XP_037928132.1 angiotensin-converting enzyme [Teleopsis dalmanni]
MSWFNILLTFLLFLHVTLGNEPKSVDEELQKFLHRVNDRLADLYNKEVLAAWQNEIKGPNDLVALLQSDIATQEIISYLKKISTKAAKFKRLNITDEKLKTQLAKIPVVGYEVLDNDDLDTMYAVTTNMSDIYRNVKLCSFTDPNNCNLTLVPDVQHILHSSKNIAEIEFYWLEWRKKTGTAAKDDFIQFVELYRKTAKLNGFAKPSDYWFRDLEENSVEAFDLLDNIMTQLRPLFEQFHAYIRSELRQIYGSELIEHNKPYPQNLAEIFIGNSYRRTEPEWYVNLPYNDVGLPNITEGLFKRALNNSQRMFWNVAEYYRSIGLPQLEEKFWTDNTMPRADTDDVTCWHKAWKYYGNQHVNLSYCPITNEERFMNMFEAISDVYYYQAYQDQPTLFEDEPFPNFSDALGKVFSMAASSPKYLEKLKIIENKFTTKDARINRLYVMGLRTIFLLPVFYVLDRYRVDVIDEKIDVSNNCAYWELTEKYTGAEPPIVRTNNDFDAPAKLLMEVDDQYTSHLMSTVLQFQLYKRFCELTGQYKQDDPNLPLDLCDLSNQTIIGPLLLDAISLGSSKSYKDIIYMLTNDNELKLDGLLEYFQPLYDWLVEQNKLRNEEIGWTNSDRCVS